MDICGERCVCVYGAADYIFDDDASSSLSLSLSFVLKKKKSIIAVDPEYSALNA